MKVIRSNEKGHLYYYFGMLVSLTDEQIKKIKKMGWENHIEKALDDEFVI